MPECDFELDETLDGFLQLHEWVEQLDEVKEKISETNAQNLLHNLERKLLHKAKIPLSEETRNAFKESQKPVTDDFEFRHNTVPRLYRSLLLDMLNNWCSCQSGARQPAPPYQTTTIKGIRPLY
jgi:hypothetical protein